VNRKILFLAAVVSLLLVRSASASISFTYTGIVGSTWAVNGTYQVAANTSQTVNIYLVEIDTNGSSSLIASEKGLYSAAFNATIKTQNPSGGTTITGAAFNGQTEPDGFTGNTNKFIYNNIPAGSGTGSSASVQEITNNNYNGANAPSGTTNGGQVVPNGSTTTTYVWLGSLTIAVGASANSTYTVQSFHDAPAGTFDAGSFGNTLSWTNFIDFDNTNDSGFTFTGANGNPGNFTLQTVTGTPEPSSMLLCGFAACGMGLGYWRRRKAKLAAAAAEQTETPAVA
jgi:hypothetical protein